MYAEFYKQHIEQASVSGNLVTGLCPFHEDGNQSFSAYVDTGTWACFGACQLKGREPVEFVARKLKVSQQEAYQILAEAGLSGQPKRKPGRPKKDEAAEPAAPKLVPDGEVQAKHTALLENPDVLEAVCLKRGWTRQAVLDYEIGWDQQDDRIWFPVRNAEGECVNVRRYDWNHKGKQKFLHYAQGYGHNMLWPIPVEKLADGADLILFEGEPDCLLALSMGLPALTTISGAGSSTKLRGRNVTIVYDLDESGTKGATKMAGLIKGMVKEVKVLKLPAWEGMPHNADFTDWVKAGHTNVDFVKLLAELWKPVEAEQVSLPTAVKQENYNKTLKVSAVASGKNLSPYQVPKSGVVVCPQGLRCCKSCGIEASGGMHVFEIAADSPKLIECVDESSNRVRAVLREHLGIPTACTAHELEVQKVQNLYDIKLTSVVDMEQPNEKTPYIAIQCWSEQELELNTPFLLTAKAMPDPKTQAGTLLITEVQAGHMSIDDVHYDADRIKSLEVFQP